MARQVGSDRSLMLASAVSAAILRANGRVQEAMNTYVAEGGRARTIIVPGSGPNRRLQPDFTSQVRGLQPALRGNAHRYYL